MTDWAYNGTGVCLLRQIKKIAILVLAILHQIKHLIAQNDHTLHAIVVHYLNTEAPCINGVEIHFKP